MQDRRLDVNSDAASVYANLFTTAGGDDTVGALSGPDAQLCAQYRDWYRSQPVQSLQISYNIPSSNKSMGYYLPHPSPTKRTAIVIHGITSSWRNTGPWVRVFYDLGFNILTPNLRS